MERYTAILKFRYNMFGLEYAKNRALLNVPALVFFAAILVFDCRQLISSELCQILAGIVKIFKFFFLFICS